MKCTGPRPYDTSDGSHNLSNARQNSQEDRQRQWQTYMCKLKSDMLPKRRGHMCDVLMLPVPALLTASLLSHQ